MERRACGLLCHITSLPSRYGIGDFGPGAMEFAKFLAEHQQSYWQVLPLNPTDVGTGNSPYNSLSAFAGNPLFISPQHLYEDGLVSKADLDDAAYHGRDGVDYRQVMFKKQQLLARAFQTFQKVAGHPAFQAFCAEHSKWLEDFATFSALHKRFQERPIWQWPDEIRSRTGGEYQRLRRELHNEIDQVKFQQYQFARQWQQLKRFCNGLGIQVIGDFPFFMDYDAADIWIHPEFFQVNRTTLKAERVAGAPPDNFSAQGQRFGCLAYNWEQMQRDRFSWWIARFKHLLGWFDILRIDHFRGFLASWEVPEAEDNAINGQWYRVHFNDLMNCLLKHLPTLPFFAEDLGTITPDVREAMQKYRIPGVKMLLFGFAKEMRDAEFLLHNHVEDAVVYTGNHDTNTIQGWFSRKDNQEDKELFSQYLGRTVDREANWEMVRLALMSVARTAIIPVQDILGIGSEGRMNEPGRAGGNWQWRLKEGELTEEVGRRLADMTVLYGRA